MDRRDSSAAQNLDYWRSFYSKEHTMEPSPFARFARPLVRGLLVDIGCGNGRDTAYFLETGDAIGIDPATVGGNALDLPPADTYYARFFFHSVPEEVEDAVLDQVEGLLLAECRAVGDDSFTDDHYRRLIEPNVFLSKLIDGGFVIKYFELGHGLAVYGDEDPLVFRVVAER